MITIFARSRYRRHRLLAAALVCWALLAAVWGVIALWDEVWVWWHLHRPTNNLLNRDYK